jgi:hypothetical protein
MASRKRGHGEGEDSVRNLRRLLCWLRREHTNPMRIGDMVVCRDCLAVWKA